MYGKQAETRGREAQSKRRLPDIYGTYRVETLLGTGGSGAVYKAWHTRLRKYIVIKEAGNCSSDVYEARRNEVEALKSIKNKHVPQVYDFLIEDKCCFTVMEYIEGESFDKLLEQGRQFEESQLFKWYRRLASILEAIHEHGIFHRDIKPANIMLTPDGDVCLIDFNAALVSGNGARVISRSPGYASPEQLEHYRSLVSTCAGKGETRSDNAETELQVCDCITEVLAQDDVRCRATTGGVDWKRSDIYSLGATMYHLLTGIHPPERREEIELLSKQSKYSGDIADIIERSMRIKPLERFSTARELGEAIENTALTHGGRGYGTQGSR
jgi:serine/threonine protein kinase